jgi:hypothetical protein
MNLGKTDHHGKKAVPVFFPKDHKLLMPVLINLDLA